VGLFVAIMDAENGGEYCEDGGWCPAGLECMMYQGAQLCCPDGDCTESVTVPHTQLFNNYHNDDNDELVDVFSYNHVHLC
jgi:hypothetical protein